MFGLPILLEWIKSTKYGKLAILLASLAISGYFIGNWIDSNVVFASEAAKEHKILQDQIDEKASKLEVRKKNLEAEKDNLEIKALILEEQINELTEKIDSQDRPTTKQRSRLKQLEQKLTAAQERIDEIKKELEKL